MGRREVIARCAGRLRAERSFLRGARLDLGARLSGPLRNVYGVRACRPKSNCRGGLWGGVGGGDGGCVSVVRVWRNFGNKRRGVLPD